MAQKTRFAHYTVEDGMQNNIVFQATQDTRGLMWFATMTGIDRFDGNQFIHYPLPQKTGGFTTYGQVPFILKDDQQQIWAASSGAVYLYNPESDAFELPRVINGQLENNRNITCFGQGNGLLLVGNSNGFFIYNYSDKRVYAPGAFNQFVRFLYQDKRGVVWVCTNKGIQRFIINGKALSELPGEMPALLPLKNSPVSLLVQDDRGRYWIGSPEKGLFVFDESRSSLQAVALPKSVTKSYVIKDIHHDKNKGLTYITLDGGGLILLDSSLQIAGSCLNNEDDPASISSNAAYDVFVDEYQRVWVTTYGGGVNVVQPVVQPFVNYQHEINNENSLSNNAAKAVVEDAEGHLWLGTRKGLSRYDPVSKNWKQINESTHSPAFTSDNVLVLAGGPSPFIWAGTYGGGLLRIDIHSGDIRNYMARPEDSATIGTDYVYALLHDSKGRIWSGGIRGAVSFLSPGSDKFTRIRTSVISVNCLVEDSKGRILAGTEKGLFIIRDKVLDNLFPGVVTEKIQAVAEYAPDHYWLGTMGGGIIEVSLGKGILKRYTSVEGLPSDVICALLKDKNGDIWAGTSKGIAHFQVSAQSFTVYTKADGLPGSQVNYGAAYKTRSGELIFGTTNGFSAFDPLKIKTRGYKPVIVLTALSVNNRQQQVGEKESPLPVQLDAIPELILQYNQNSFTVDFVNTSPSLSGKHLYSWKLEGFDRQWSKASIIPSAVYTNLNSGHYKLLIKAFSKGQSEDAAIRELPIRIMPPWWKTGWAYAGYFLMLAGGIFAAYHYYRNFIARKKYAERLRLNTSISHEIRTPLTLIKGPVNALVTSPGLTDENRSNLLLAKKNIEKLENIISQFIDYQKTGVDKMQMQVKSENIVPVIDDVCASFTPLMKEKNIHFIYTRPSEPIVLLFDRDKIEKILNNLLSNAVKYTLASQNIAVAVQQENKQLVIKVTDTGIGIPEGQQQFIFKGYFRADNTVNLKETGSGIGLNVAKELVEMHHGKLSFTSTPGTGTTFFVKIPLNNEALKPYLVKLPFTEITEGIPSLQEVQPGKSGRKHIVIAEDNDELRSYLERELTGAGYKVLAASDGAAALTLIQKNQTDIVITDVMMPEMNGFQLCEKLKKELNTCHIPVIMLTAIHDKDYLLEGYRSGADDYVKKPFDLAYIITRVENLLQNRTRFRSKILSVFENQEPLVTDDTDVSWLKTATETIVENINHPDFSVEKLSSLMAMSRPVLFRRFKSITGESPQHYISQVRLRKAVELLQQRKFNINEVAFECGFADAKYFSTTFKKQYGKTPSEYVKDLDSA